MEQLNNLDVIFLIIVGVSALVGIARGMTKEILSVAGWVLAAAAVFYLVPLLDPIMQQYIASKILSTLVSGLIILIVFCIFWILTVDRLGSVVRASRLSALDRILGFVFGAARGVLIVILVALMISTLIPEQSKNDVFKDSQYFKVASDSAEPLKKLIPSEWVDSFKAKTEEFMLVKNDKSKDETKKDEKSEQQEPTISEKIKKAAEAVDNLQALKKDGEELFNQLAQPKTASGEASEDEDLSSDLDKLLDVLEDRVVTTDEKTPQMKSKTQEIMENVKDKVEK